LRQIAGEGEREPLLERAKVARQPPRDRGGIRRPAAGRDGKQRVEPELGGLAGRGTDHAEHAITPRACTETEALLPGADQAAPSRISGVFAEQLDPTGHEPVHRLPRTQGSTRAGEQAGDRSGSRGGQGCASVRRSRSVTRGMSSGCERSSTGWSDKTTR